MKTSAILVGSIAACYIQYDIRIADGQPPIDALVGTLATVGVTAAILLTLYAFTSK